MPSRVVEQKPKPSFQEDRRLPVVVILGPTAVGKTVLSIQLAERLDGEIISADSRLLYRGMDIGTAKPTLEERNRVPHHLIDVADPDEVWSLATYHQHAQRAIHEIHARSRLPLLVGGTGQYLRTITLGWQIPAVRPDPRLRAALESWSQSIGKEGLHYRLSRLDPPAAENIDYRNLRRTVRALEVIFTTGQRFSDLRRSGMSTYRLLQIGLTRPRKDLYARIDRRIDAMIENGLIEEVQGLLKLGYSPDLPTLSAIGYREIIAYLQGEIDLQEAITLIKRNSRTLVRRQANWFKPDDPEICWFEANTGVLDQIEAAIRDWR